MRRPSRIDRYGLRAVDGLRRFEHHLGPASENDLLGVELGRRVDVLAARLRCRIIHVDAQLDPGPALRHRQARGRIDRNANPDAGGVLGLVDEDALRLVLAHEPARRGVLELAVARLEAGRKLRPPATERDRLGPEAGEALVGGPPERQVLDGQRLLRAGEIVLHEPWLAGLAGGRRPPEPDRAVVRIGLEVAGAAGIRWQSEARDEVPAESVGVGRPAGQEGERAALERPEALAAEAR